MDVTCDNLLAAVKQTVEEDTLKLSMRRETELTINLREAVFEEQQLSAKVSRFEGLNQSSIDLMDPSSGALQKLASNPRKKAVGLLRTGNVYEAARLDKNASGASTSTPLMFSLLKAVQSQTAAS